MNSKKISVTRTLLKQFEVLNVSYVAMIKLSHKGKGFENYLKVVLEYYPQKDFNVNDVENFDDIDSAMILNLCSEAAYKDFIKTIKVMKVASRVTKEQIGLFLELVDSAFAFYHQPFDADNLVTVIEDFLLARHQCFAKEQLLNVYDTVVHAVPEYDFFALESLPELACPDIDELVVKARRELHGKAELVENDEMSLFCQGLDADGNMAEA